MAKFSLGPGENGILAFLKVDCDLFSNLYFALKRGLSSAAHKIILSQWTKYKLLARSGTTAVDGQWLLKMRSSISWTEGGHYKQPHSTISGYTVGKWWLKRGRLSTGSRYLSALIMERIDLLYLTGNLDKQPVGIRSHITINWWPIEQLILPSIRQDLRVSFGSLASVHFRRYPLKFEKFLHVMEMSVRISAKRCNQTACQAAELELTWVNW